MNDDYDSSTVATHTQMVAGCQSPQPSRPSRCDWQLKADWWLPLSERQYYMTVIHSDTSRFDYLGTL
eukprot:6202284-Pleurochrysis_carterae.AAC.1